MGFTMLEIVVGIVLLTIGALGYAVVTTSIARAFVLDSRRARAGNVLESQREIVLRDGCSRARAGSDTRFGMQLQWSVGPVNGSTRTLGLTLLRPGVYGPHTDSLIAVLPCV
jgi:type II secretory pathway pseudopilin PulG